MDPKNRRWLEAMKKAHEPVEGVTKEERLKRFDFGDYLKFLAWGKRFAFGLKGEVRPSEAEAAEKIHREALRLKMIDYHGHESR